MASQNVHGITIDLDVNTSGVSSSFKEINSSLTSTSRELKAVDKLLKEDANNTVLLAQKQKLLSDAIQKTNEKLKTLNEAKAKADSDDSIDKDSKSYRELERDIENTKKKLEQYQKAQDEVAESMGETSKEADKMGDKFEEASEGALKFGDVLKANILADFIVDGIKKLADTVKDFANDLNEWADSYRELEVYERQFESNIRNTADASDDEIKALKDLARQKEKQGVISKRAITSAYQELATYVESTDAIEGLTDALVDMAAQQYGVDATEESVRNIATTLGKALANGDYSGLTKLGYGFNKNQQYIMKYGNELQRVAVLNEVIESSIGGMNQALSETDAGKLFEMKTYFDDVKTSVGELVSELQVGFAEQIMPTLQPLIDNVLQWLLDHKDDLVQMVENIVEWLTSEEMVQFYGEVGELVLDIGDIMNYVIKIGEDIGLWEGIFNAVKGVVEGIKELFDAIAADVAAIKGGGVGSWMMNNYMNTDWGGSFGPMQSGGMMSGSITLNNTFTINNGQNIDRSTVMQWADVLTDRINENLGRMV